MEETRVIYYIDEDKGDKVPYLVKLNVAPENACLRDFKKVLNPTRNFKYFFQTIVDDIGIVKQDICDDDAKLPVVSGRVVSWLVPVEEPNQNGGGGGGGGGGENRSNNECNNKQANEATDGQQFSSTHSIATTASSNGSSSNNENKSDGGKQAGAINLANNARKSKSNYDSLTRKHSSGGHYKPMNTPLKNLNCDETSTDTESLVNEFNDLKMMYRNKQQSNSKRQHHFGSFNNHYRHHHQAPMMQRGGSLGHHHHHHHYNHNHHYHHPYHKPVAAHGTTTSGAAGGPPSNMLIPTYKSNKLAQFDSVSMLSASDHDTTTFFDSQSEYDGGQDEDEDDDDVDDDQFSSITASSASTATTASMMLSKREKRRRSNKNRYLLPARGGNFLHRHNSLQSSMSSLADSTMSLNIITVKLNMDTANFLGISIVGQSNKTGEGGIYVGSIMEGGAVALDGRIEPGDMILQVNDISFENMSNDDAVRVLREAVMKPGPVKLVVAKCWDPNPKGFFQLSKKDPVYPINPSAWVAHTQATLNNKGEQLTAAVQQRGAIHHHHLDHSMSSLGGSTASFSTTFADSTITSVNAFGPGNNNYQYHQYNKQQYGGMGGGGGANQPTVLTSDSTRFGCSQELNLTAESDMELIVRTMAAPDSGLDVRERNWLKITIPGAFIGSDLVDWLFNHVEGFPERRDARKYASMLLKNGHIRHAVNRLHFSERSYYVFGDQASTFLTTQNGTQPGSGTLFTVDEESSGDFDSVSEFDRESVVNNYAAPMSFPIPPPRPHVSSSQPPGLTFGQQQALSATNIYSHQPKIYSNVLPGGIGGPNADHPNTQHGNYHHSSSSSNVTSNSTSTTSQNTTTATTTSTSGQGVGAIASDRPNSSCQLYYPTPAGNNTNSTINSSAVHNKTEQSVNETITTQSLNPAPQNSFISNMYSSAETNGRKPGDNRSVKSSENSSSGNASDQELLSSRSAKSKSEKQRDHIYGSNSNYYELNRINSSSKLGQQTSNRGIDKVPMEIRVSKQSFCQAMENPCEFFVDVM